MKKFTGIIIAAILIIIIIGRCASVNRNNQVIMNEQVGKDKQKDIVDTITIGEYVYNIDGSLSDLKAPDGKPMAAKEFLSVIEGWKVVSTDTFRFETAELADGFYEKISEKYYSESSSVKAYMTENNLIRVINNEFNVVYPPYNDKGRWLVKLTVYKPE